MRRILLVEDEPALVITLTDMLKSEGYLVENTTNGLDAKDRIVADTFDLVILDVMLPGMNGFEVCKSSPGGRGFGAHSDAHGAR